MVASKQYTRDVNLPRSAFNEAYLPYLDDPTRTQIFFGGSSSGKSVFLAQRTVYDILRGGHNYLIVRNVSNSLRSSTFNEIQKVINLRDPKKGESLSQLFKINKSEMLITCANGFEIAFKGLDDVEKIKSITPKRGVITDIWIEEATETTEEDVKQLEKRLRGKAKVPKRIILSFNPILKLHWIYQKYFAGVFMDDDRLYKDDGLLIFKTTYKDNRFLEQDDIDALENETNPYWYDVYTLGKWGILGDLVYTNWKVEDLSDRKEAFDNFYNGLDFGFSNNPTALIRTHYNRDRKTIYVIDEVYEKGLTNPQIAGRIKPILGDEYVVCDSAEPKSIEELRQYGVNALAAKKGKDSIRFGIQWLQQQTIIVDKSCQNTINELSTYQWKKDKDGNSLLDPVQKNDHLCLDGDTMITTISGLKPIKNIRVGEYVCTRKGFKKVLASGSTGICNVYRYFVDGVVIEGTKDHRVYVKGKQFVPLKDILLCDTPMKIKLGGITKWMQSKLSITEGRIEDIQKQKIEQAGFISRHQGQKGVQYTFIDKFMKIITERYLKVIACITRTVVRLITTLRISNYLKQGNILACTQINTRSRYVVQRVAPIPLGQRKVYNLTVEDAHEYFANGILVSNCDALRYAYESGVSVFADGDLS